MIALRGFGLALIAGLVPLALHGCGGDDANSLAAGGRSGSGGKAGSAGGPSGAGVGKACSASKPCRTGLTCAAGLCAPGGSTPNGMACVISGECANGTCNKGTCTTSGALKDGLTCQSDLECALGLRCQLAGLTSVCQPQGVGDVGAGCQANVDCFGGLYCVKGACAPPSPSAPMGGTPFEGVACDPIDTKSATRAYFEVPGATGAAAKDFFRLPFPNDARLGAGDKLDIASFPTPGVGALGFDPVVRYVVAAQESEHGFGTDPVVLFRFSNAIDETTLDEESLHFVDISEDSADFGKDALGEWYYSRERTPYVCGDWLGLRRPLGTPMTPGHTYAVFLTSRVRAADGSAVTVAENLGAVLGDAAPRDAALAAVHARYAPFRAYLAGAGLDASDVVNASVITAARVREPMAALAAAVEAEAPPEAHDWVKCDAGVTSPCPDHDASQQRNCEAAAKEYDEYHALVDLPIFQRGSAPYLTPADGGEIDARSPVRSEAVCLSLTVPKSEMPDGGWPVVVFAHGTGGNFRDHVQPAIAGALAAAPLPSGGSVGFAVLGIDQVSHGPRRGSTQQDPEGLFFNIGNPAAARGNALQGATDQLALGRFVANLDATVDGVALKADPERIFFFGHSQGSSEGSLMLPYAPSYRAAVLSGNGASLRESLLAKTSPVDVRAALPFVLSDPSVSDPEKARNHPVLTLIQHWIDPADPVNFARALAVEPIAPHGARHVFQTYGLRDSYSPARTLQSFALAGGFTLVGTPGTALDPIGELTAVSAPLAGNVDGFTLGVREYTPTSPSDGHFVAFTNDEANADIVRFFAMAANGDVPAIGE